MRNGGRGRPLNSVVRHQTMDSVIIIVIVSVIGGAGAAWWIRSFLPDDVQLKIERRGLRAGSVGWAVGFVPCANLIEREISRTPIIAIGLILSLPLATGVALAIVRYMTERASEAGSDA
jgi:hypothetical protein